MNDAAPGACSWHVWRDDEVEADRAPHGDPFQRSTPACTPPSGGQVSRRSNGHLRCATCRMRTSLCICELIVPLTTPTRLVLVIHREEDKKSTNTGRLATRCLVNSAVSVRGTLGDTPEPLAIDPGYQPLLLFPHADAVSIATWRGSTQPIALVVPDGTWRQAAKVRHRVPGLDRVPCVTLPAGAPSAYRLRLEAHEGGLATFEAVARAFGILEGGEVERALTYVFRAMVERTLWSRGTVGKEQVQCGVPRVAHEERQRSGWQPRAGAKVES